MSAFKNEFGDVVAWRVALAAGGALSASVALAVALFGRMPAPAGPTGAYGKADAATFEFHPAPRDSADPAAQAPEATGDAQEGDAGQPTTGPVPEATPDAPSEAAPVADDAWLTVTEGTQGREAWDCLTPEARSSLRAAVLAWADSNMPGAAVSSVALESGRVDGASTSLVLLVEADGRTATVDASIAPGATWQVTEAALDGRVAIADVAGLAGTMGEDVASEVSRQLMASGIEGAAGAYTTLGSIVVEGPVTRLAIWADTGSGGTIRYDAAFDAGVGLLELTPAGEGAL